MKTTYGIILLNPQLQILAVHPTRHHWNQWDIPKGLGDEGETPLQSVMREFKEETSVDLDSLVPIDQINDLTKHIGEITYKSNKKKLHPFIGLMEKDFESANFKCNSNVEGLTIGGVDIPTFPEVDAFTWVDLADYKHVFHESQVRAITDALSLLPVFKHIKLNEEIVKSNVYG